MTDPIHLVYAADGGFTMPVAVSLHSVLRHLTPGRAAHVWIVDGGFSSQQRRRIEVVARRGAGDRDLKLRWVTPSREWWRGVELDFTGKHLNETVLYRLGIPHFLPDHVEKVIYIDGDVLGKGDVSGLEAEIDHAHGVTAVRDYCLATWGLRYWHRPEPLAALELSGDEPYFNAGVLGISVTYWREHRVAEAAAQFLNERTDLAGFYDQDALNYVLRGRWKALYPGWNFPPTCRDTVSRRGATVQERTGYDFDELQRTAKLVHFTGAKPWNQGHTNPERPAWIAELKMSRYFGFVGYALWSARWHLNLLRRGLHKTWLYKVQPKLRSRLRTAELPAQG